ncbi:MAG: hypothetical protein OHK0053_36370 [Microscillaceae bacterium]
MLRAQIDTEFWFVAPSVDEAHGDRPILLRFSTFDQPAQVIVSQPANPGFSPLLVSVGANSTQSIDLTSQLNNIENRPANQVLNKGLRIQATATVTAYYEVANAANPEIFTLKGRNALGTEFLIPSQDRFPNQNGSEALDIVATENNTLVSITPTAALQGRPAGVPFTVILQRGETFSARVVGIDAATHLQGTRVVASKPIALTISDDSILTGSGWDLIGDQLIPIHLAGKEHILVRGFAFQGAEVGYVLAIYPNTVLLQDGAVVANLQVGQTFSFDLNNFSTFLESSEPVYVMHLSGHPNEAASAVLPHLACTGSTQIGFVRSSPDDFALFLLIRNGHQQNFSINGNATLVTANDFVVVPGTQGAWVVARKEFNSSQIPVGQATLVSNSTGLFHLGILNNLGASSEYGYFSDYASLNLGPDYSACQGDSVVLRAGAGAISYLWSDGSTEAEAVVRQSGTYWVEVNKGTCVLRDTVQVNFRPLPQPVFNNLALQYCLNGETVTLSATPTGGVFRINGQTQFQLNPAELGVGTHQIEYQFTDINNCTGRVHQEIEVIAPPNDLAFVGLEEGYCQSTAPQALQATLPGGTFYIDGQPTEWLQPALLGFGNHTARYDYRDALGCTYQISQRFEIVGPPEALSPVTDSLFVCPDNVGGLFLQANFARQYEWRKDNELFVSGQAQLFEVTSPGIYHLRMDNGYGCERTYTFEVFGKCEPTFLLPEAFSPNGDGLNDVLEIFGGDFVNLDFRVFNRWGENVFALFSPLYFWNGNSNGRPVPAGVYYWKARYAHPLYPERIFEKSGRVLIVH